MRGGKERERERNSNSVLIASKSGPWGDEQRGKQQKRRLRSVKNLFLSLPAPHTKASGILLDQIFFSIILLCCELRRSRAPVFAPLSYKKRSNEDIGLVAAEEEGEGGGLEIWVSLLLLFLLPFFYPRTHLEGSRK